MPLTTLCRDYCGYCTFRRDPGEPGARTLTPDEVVALVQAGSAGSAPRRRCSRWAIRPEARFAEHREFLTRHGHRTTLGYLRAMCELTLTESTLLPHANPGLMGERDLAALREVNVSMGIMLETLSERLLARGRARQRARQGPGPAAAHDRAGRQARHSLHHRHPHRDRRDAARAASTRCSPSAICTSAGATSGGHRPELPGQARHPDEATRPSPRSTSCCGRSAVARLLLGPDMNIQAPPNLSPGVYARLLAAGLNDWGGVSPLTPDHINPEKPWPGLRALREATESQGLRSSASGWPSIRVRDARRVPRRAPAARVAVAGR